MAEFVGVPLYVVHVMSKDALEQVGRALGCVCTVGKKGMNRQADIAGRALFESLWR